MTSRPIANKAALLFDPPPYTSPPGRGVCRRSIERLTAFFALALTMVLAFGGCGALADLDGSADVFRDLTPIVLDGTSQTLRGNLLALGELSDGDSLQLNVVGDSIEAVMLLFSETADTESALIVGGGPGNVPTDYAITTTGTYFAFVEFEPTVTGGALRATVEASLTDAAMTRPTQQYVRVNFAEGFLSNPGLFDPIDGTSDDQALLESLAPIVQADIIDRLRAIFTGTPIVILAPDDPQPDAPVSQLTYVPERVVADDQESRDAAQPPADPTRPQCQTRVVFGEVLPSGVHQDTGNRILDDEAVVYVGSFQGRGQECWTSAVNSVSSMVLTLAQTGAHEIGHLVGLYHIEQVDLMNRTATLAFLRELSLARGQIQLERVENGQLISEVFTGIVQDPETYFAAIFDAGGSGDATP